jgi:hypothetical protein
MTSCTIGMDYIWTLLCSWYLVDMYAKRSEQISSKMYLFCDWF